METDGQRERAPTLMVQGTTSDAGKSFLVAALGRWLARQQIRVAPFKPQNMALNSAVTVDGGEIGRAQAVQAEACGVEPHTDMNPVLLKPNTDVGAQVIIQGHAVGNMHATSYHEYKQVALGAVLESYQRLAQQYEAVIVEGAGSPAEINLRDRDIANMGFAERADCPVILIADIDRGGVFAHLVGTLDLLSASEQERVVGFVINRFRGDLSLLESGIEWLEQRTGKPVWGVIPYLQDLHFDAEDALPRQSPGSSQDPARLRVAVPALPRISNHTDFDPLRFHPQVDLAFVGPGMEPPPCDVLILPGSKSVLADLRWLRDQGWGEAISRHLRYGGKLVGICGGYQMLGESIDDPEGVEGPPASSPGLGLLELETVLKPVKALANVSGVLTRGGVPVDGYEIHCGVTRGAALARPAVQLGERSDGAISEDGQILGTYLHGLFDRPEALSELLRWAGLQDVATSDYRALRAAAFERLADQVEEHLDTAAIRRTLGLSAAGSSRSTAQG